MKFSTMVEVCAAMHVSTKVSGDFLERGGIIFVAPPGHLKTAAIEIIEEFPHARVMSNVTVKTLTGLRQDFLSGSLLTMAFSDLENIYRRHSSVSGQIEGVLMGLVGEGFRNPAFSDQRTTALPARCTVIGGITVKSYEERVSGWLDTGFARRFLWAKYYATPEVMTELEESIIQWKKKALTNGFAMKIPDNPIEPITDEESRRILWQMRFQHDTKLPLIIAKKIVSVLVWKFNRKKAWELWDDFAVSLDKDGTELTL